MNTPLFHLKKRKLSPRYFNLQSPWFFNTPDVIPFAYLLFGIVVGLFVLCLLLLFMLGLFSQPVNTSPAVNSATETAIESSGTAESTDLTSEETENLSPIVRNSQAQESIETQIQKAQSQPTYDLRLQALLKIEEKGELSADQAQQIKALKQESTQAITKAQQTYLSIENALQNEYYSTAISKSKALMDEGEILGVIYTNAKEAYEKAHLRKIEYYLKVAQLGKAEAALNEARAAQINDSKLKSYAETIQSLKEL